MKPRLNNVTVNQYAVIGIAIILFIAGIPNITSGLSILQFLNDNRNIDLNVIWSSALTTIGFGFVLVGIGIVLFLKSRLFGNLIRPKNRNRLLLAVAVFLVLFPWLQNIDVGFFNNEVMVDGITVSATIVMVITLTFSLISWGLFAWASKNISPAGATLGIISGSSMIIPFLQVLGPMAGIVVGTVAGFVAFMFQKTIDRTTTATNHPIMIAASTLTATYVVLILMILTVQDSSFDIWDTGNGIGSWTGTVEEMEGSALDHAIKSDIGFASFVAVIPSLIMTGLIIRGKKHED